MPPIMMHNGQEFHFGWNYDPPAVNAVLATLPVPTFRSQGTPLSGKGSDKNTRVLFWELEERVVKGTPAESILIPCGSRRVLPPFNQGQVGSCVGNGWGRACQDLLVIQIAMGDLGTFPGHGIAPEPIYGGSRVEIGGERGSRQDGSVGAWAGKWVHTYGLLAKQQYPGVDLTTYSADLCKEWGAKGVPSNLETEAKLRPVALISQITDVDTMADLLANYNPVAVCGPWNYAMKRSPGGFCVRGGHSQGGHCRMKCGVVWVKGGSTSLGSDGAGPSYAGDFRMIFERNSWGDYLGEENNQVTLVSGETITLPSGVFGTRDQDHQADLSQEDTFGTNNATNWIPQNVPWIS